MARIRTIKPELPQSESMGNVSRDARLTFILMWTLSDDEGRLRGNSRMLASLLFPYDDDAPELIEAWLLELEKEECIVRYKIGGQSYVQICNWLIHQKIDKPSKSKIPAFDPSSREFANPRDDSSEDQGPKDQGSKEGKGNPNVEQKPLDLSVQTVDIPEADPVETIFAFWQKVMSSPRSALDSNRKRLITNALKNYSAADICKAIRGCSKSPYNMGQNQQKTKYNGLDLILRNAEKIDRFIQLDSSQAVSQDETLEERNARLIREVMAGEGEGSGVIIEMEP